MSNKFILNNIFYNIDDFEQYFKVKRKLKNMKIDKDSLLIDFINERTKEINRLNILNIVREEKRQGRAVELYNYDLKIIIPNMDEELEINSIIDIIEKYKNPIERKFNVKKFDFISLDKIKNKKDCFDYYRNDIHFYIGKDIYVLEYLGYTIKADELNILEMYRNLERTDYIPEDILNKLKDNWMYLISYNDKDIIKLNEDTLVELRYFIKNMVNSTSYKEIKNKAEKEHIRIVWTFRLTIAFMLISLFAGIVNMNAITMIFSGLGIFVGLPFFIYFISKYDYEISFGISAEYENLLKLKGLQKFDDKYISFRENEEFLKGYNEKPLLLKESKEVKSLPINTENIKDRELKALLKATRNLINNNKTIDKNLLENYILPEINNLANNFDSLDKKSRDYLIKSINILNSKLLDDKEIKKEEDLLKFKIDSKVLYQKLQEF